MRPEDKDAGYLWDMLDAALAIQEFVAGEGPHDYLRNRMLRGAVERHLEIIGEAARCISSTFREEHTEIPWRAIIGQRNLLAHEYGDVRHEAVWNVAVQYIPKLIESLRPTLPNDLES